MQDDQNVSRGCLFLRSACNLENRPTRSPALLRACFRGSKTPLFAIMSFRPQETGRGAARRGSSSEILGYYLKDASRARIYSAIVMLSTRTASIVGCWYVMCCRPSRLRCGAQPGASDAGLTADTTFAHGRGPLESSDGQRLWLCSPVRFESPFRRPNETRKAYGPPTPGGATASMASLVHAVTANILARLGFGSRRRDTRPSSSCAEDKYAGASL